MKVSLKRQLVVDRERLPAARCSAKWQMNVLGSGPLKVSRLARSHRFQASGFTRRRVTAGTLPVLELSSLFNFNLLDTFLCRLCHSCPFAGRLFWSWLVRWAQLTDVWPQGDGAMCPGKGGRRRHPSLATFGVLVLEMLEMRLMNWHLTIARTDTPTCSNIGSEDDEPKAPLLGPIGRPYK